MEDSKNTEISGGYMTKREKRELAKQRKKTQISGLKLKANIQKTALLIVVILGLIFAGYKLWQWFNTASSTNQIQQTDILVVRDSDWIKGKHDAQLTLIEYGDFECPACSVYSQITNKLFSDFPDNLKIIFRNFPLPGHKNSVPAAKAAGAAGIQGKFWEMHDLLYDKQSDWAELSNPKDKFIEYAVNLGLNEEKFKNDFDSKEVSDRISSDESDALKLRINATPTFFLNGNKLSDIGGYEKFKSIIENALNK